MMQKQYVEKRDGAFKIAGTRVSLDSVVYAFRDGKSPETIAYDCFPTLTLEQVYGAITFYLANREEIDAYLEEGERRYNELRNAAIKANPEFYEKMRNARRKRQKSKA